MSSKRLFDMSTLFAIAVTNAIVVVPLALLAWLVGRLVRKPALTHALWIIVLLKLVTPPLVHLPLPLSDPASDHGLVQLEATAQEASRGEDNELLASLPTNESINFQIQENSQTSGDVSLAAQNELGLINELDRNSRVVVRNSRSTWLVPLTYLISIVSSIGDALATWEPLLLSVWVIGIVATLAIQCWLVVRFTRRIARVSSRDESLQMQTERLARKMGLKRSPEVRVVNATISPMLWSCGAVTKLLFPSELLNRLDSESRATLLIHELAHFSRGDHWVRLLEMLATGLFWWHPVVWLARRQIEESEEECCDAWVVGEIHQVPRCYAEALLDTIDFLCGASTVPSPMSSRLGNASFLRRRLTNIMRGASPKRMSGRVRALVALLMLILLPLQPFVFGSASRSFAPTPATLSNPHVVASPDELPSDATNLQNPINLSSSKSQFEPETEASMPVRPSPSASVPSSKSKGLRGEKVWSNAVSSHGRFVIRATTGRRILLTDRVSGRESDLSQHGITAVSFIPDGNEFAAVTNDGRVTLWDALESRELRVLHTHERGLRSVSVSPQGDVFAAGAEDGTVMILDLQTGQPRTQAFRESMPVNCVRFSPDGSRLAVALGDWSSNARGEVRLINLSLMQTETLICDAVPGAVTFVSNDELIVGEWSGHATLWNLIQHKIIGAANADKSVVAAAAFSPDNPQLREIAFVSSFANRD